MSSPFDALATRYEALWTSTRNGQEQRLAVWREMDTVLKRGQFILDAGCGTGDDAIHLMGRGVRVIGIDSSAAMVDVARSRGVDARRHSVETLTALGETFDGALSNFGVLNCVKDLSSVAEQFAAVIKPGGSLVLSLMSRFCRRETVTSLMARDWRTAVRRWPGRAKWRGLDIYYPTARSVTRTFTPFFEPVRRVKIGGGDHTVFVLTRRSEC